MERLKPITVAEMSGFRKYAPECMSKRERRELIDYIARHPAAGSIIRGTGGVRKARWAVGNRGKSSGVRVIYYFHSDDVPIFLLTVFSKSNKTSLNGSEKAAIKQAVSALKSELSSK